MLCIITNSFYCSNQNTTDHLLTTFVDISHIQLSHKKIHDICSGEHDIWWAAWSAALGGEHYISMLYCGFVLVLVSCVQWVSPLHLCSHGDADPLSW